MALGTITTGSLPGPGDTDEAEATLSDDDDQGLARPR